MKKALILAALLLTACTSETEFGPCVGIDDEREPGLSYRVSANNVFWAVVGFELIAPPLFVLFDETYCPVGVKK